MSKTKELSVKFFFAFLTFSLVFYFLAILLEISVGHVANGTKNGIQGIN